MLLKQQSLVKSLVKSLTEIGRGTVLGLFPILSGGFSYSIFRWFFPSLSRVCKERNCVLVKYVQLRDPEMFLISKWLS